MTQRVLAVWPRTTIKICGLSTPQDVDLCCALGVDYIGLVYYPDSPRHVALSAAQLLARRVRQQSEATRTVLLLVDPAPKLLTQALAIIEPDFVQFHGSETPEEIAAVRAKHGVGAFKAIGVRELADIEAATAYRGVSDRIIFDAKPPKAGSEAEKRCGNTIARGAATPSGKPLPGGNGAAFDWDLMAAVPANMPYLLSGGLTPETVAGALAATRAPGVDVSSGVEAARGVKDPAKITRFVEAVRAADLELSAETRSSTC